MSARFANARLLLPNGTISLGDLRVEEGKITGIGDRLATIADESSIDCAGCFLAPGFIDLHVHGALGRDTMEATPEAFEAICRYHSSGGTTTAALTTICASWLDIGLVLDTARAWREESGRTGARLAGIHVEGPYFSRQKPGAHHPGLIRDPKPDDLDHWTRYTDVITQITLAPELPGMRELIPALVEAGIRVSGGHSDAWDEDAQIAFAAGLRQVTHTFNCMSSARRRGPYRVAGLLEAALAHPEVVCEVIADGKHVSPTLLRMLWNAKGASHVALITDATAGAGLERGAEFSLGDIHCRVDDGVALTSDGSALAGSTCRMIDGLRTLVREAGVPVEEAVLSATLTPADTLGCSDLGRLEIGATADLVLFDEEFQVRQTWVRGRKVFEI
ncbi:MAG TPA: N-acetylglucosamine-6-phosphate deacetylase [Chthoniobacterales bacterium]|nr:N-acetylglucosamine-6-phosphate deacetylase [Chthoniobacterales bacterium]